MQIKQCPWCGSDKKKVLVNYGKDYDHGFYMKKIKCGKCGKTYFNWTEVTC